MSVPHVRARAFGAPILVLALALGGATAGCSGHDADTGSPADAATAPVRAAEAPVQAEAPVPKGHAHMPAPDEIAAAWAARPDYVRALPGDWQGAYAYALARPDVLQWLPCHCGCAGMDHRSNLDCFFKPREDGDAIAFEEHASYCDICVETANMAARMLREGKTMIEIRAAVDVTFGGAAPGTDTPLPPAS